MNITRILSTLALCGGLALGMAQPAQADGFRIGYHHGWGGWHRSGYSVSVGLGGPVYGGYYGGYYGGGYYAAPAYYDPPQRCYYDYYGVYRCRAPYYGPAYYSGYYGPAVSIGYYRGWGGRWYGGHWYRGGGWHGGHWRR